MKKQFSHVFTTIILIFILSAHQGQAADKKVFKGERSLGILKIGRDANILNKLGMPLPLEEGGFHILYNSREKVYLRTSFHYLKPKKWLLKTVRLSYRDNFFERVRLNNQSMLTGVSLLGLKTGGGIGLGDKKSDVLKTYGHPTNMKSNKILLEWIYIKKRGKSREYLSFVFRNEIVVAINMGGE